MRPSFAGQIWLEIVFIKLYRQVVGIPMGTNCAPMVADLFLFCYERDFMMSLSDDKQADVIDAFTRPPISASFSKKSRT